MRLSPSRLLTLTAAAAIVTSANSICSGQTALDSFDTTQPAYADGFQYGDNGGSGFGPLSYLGGNGGGLFTGDLDGDALGIFAGDTDGQAVGRDVNGLLSAGTYSLALSFNVSNANGFTGFNLKSTSGGGFGGGELLFIGLTTANGNGSFVVGDATTTGQQLVLGSATDLRFQRIDFSISFDTGALTYSVTATVRSTGATGTISGSLKDANGGAVAGAGDVSSVGFANFSFGPNNDLIVDTLNLTAIPEPSTVSLLVTSAVLGGCFYARRRQRA